MKNFQYSSLIQAQRCGAGIFNIDYTVKVRGVKPRGGHATFRGTHGALRTDLSADIRVFICGNPRVSKANK